MVRRGERGHLVLTLALPWWRRLVRWRRGEPPARAEQQVFRCGAEAETWGRLPITTATFHDRQEALAEHGRVVDALIAGEYERSLVRSFLTTLGPLLEAAAAAVARGDLVAALASYDGVLARCRAWDSGRVFFAAYQDVYLLRAAVLERLDPEQAYEAYRAFITLYAGLDRPEAATMEAVAVARRAVERLARRFREPLEAPK
ncbi:MAG: hypothetical protein HY575_04875 [candidate division NC10 bacterium]|nr:hypothetical protein [candidate division NC10 bacterium]